VTRRFKVLKIQKPWLPPKGLRWLLPAILLLGAVLVLLGQEPLPIVRAAGPVSLSGRLLDPHGEPVRGAEVIVREGHSSKPIAIVESQHDGSFLLDLPPRQFSFQMVVEINRTHFQSREIELEMEDVARLNAGESVRLPDIEMARHTTPGFWVASLVFGGVLGLIALEKLHNTMAAMLGAAVVLGTSFVGGAINPNLFIFNFGQALEYVHFDVIFLVTGMMIVIGVIEETGIFQWMAYQAYRLSGGRAWLLVIILMIITAIASALLDNVTTMLLMTPITIQIALAVGINPLSLLLPEVLASNVGGISTLIGTPTNILIGSYASLTFNDFLRNLTPGVLLAMAILIAYVLVYYRKQLFTRGSGLSTALLERLKESGRITQTQKLTKASIVFAVMLVLFVIGERIHLVPAVTATMGAVAMLLWVAPDIEEMLKVVDWTTLMFFIALFILVGAIQEVGLISVIAASIGRLVGDNLAAAILVVTWSAGSLSGVVDNIPFTAAMLPVVGFLTSTVPGAASSQVLYYSLSVGAAMGGNSTLIGASANLVTAGIAERAGYRITYVEFIKVGLPAMILTVATGAVWLFIRF
jgi:Na+/H+ antiporter NhaD/arsenite permease-like protein